jgi:hypothetical protein
MEASSVSELVVGREITPAWEQAKARLADDR